MKLKRIATFLLCLALLFVVEGSSISPLFIEAEAASTYSNVLDDLKKDKTFSVDNYRTDNTANSLQIIQIAESENKELFVYVYQPGIYNKEYKAQYVNMSLQDKTARTPIYQLYSLTYLNTDGVFQKYKVNGLLVSNEQYRYYNIASIYRLYDKDVDTKPEAVDGINCKGFPVGSLWCAYNYNNTVVYEHETVDVVQIDIVASDFIRYNAGYLLYVGACDAHFIGFNIVGYDVDKIIDADVTYTYRSVEFENVMYVNPVTTYGNPITEVKTLRSEGEESLAENSGYGLFGKKYTWKRIQSLDSFLKYIDDEGIVFNEGELEEIKKCQFIFNFLETDYIYKSDVGYKYEKYYEVQSIGVLRLHFLVGETSYNLGCVSDLVFNDETPAGQAGYMNDDEMFEVMMKLLMLIAICVFVVPPLSAVLPVIGKLFFDAVIFALQALFWLVALPFRFFNVRKQKKQRVLLPAFIIFCIFFFVAVSLFF